MPKETMSHLDLKGIFYEVYPNTFDFENEDGIKVNVHQATYAELEYIIKQSTGILDVGDFEYYVSKTGNPIITGSLHWAIPEEIDYYKHWDSLMWDTEN